MSNISLTEGVSNKNKTLSHNIIRNVKEGSTNIIDTKTKSETDNKYEYEHSNRNIKYTYIAIDSEDAVKDKVSSDTKNIIQSPDERFTVNNSFHGKPRTRGNPSNKTNKEDDIKRKKEY